MEAPRLALRDPQRSAPAPGPEALLHTPQGAQQHISSTLGEETALLASARKAALAGSYAAAMADLQRLLELYPRSILAQNARVEHFRALKHLDRSAEARRAALRYLSDYPSGFARDEARSLALEGK
jgi:outer membrane protein assembly factor BamD (BamD/ComL family)